MIIYGLIGSLLVPNGKHMFLGFGCVRAFCGTGIYALWLLHNLIICS